MFGQIEEIKVVNHEVEQPYNEPSYVDLSVYKRLGCLGRVGSFQWLLILSSLEFIMVMNPRIRQLA